MQVKTEKIMKKTDTPQQEQAPDPAARIGKVGPLGRAWKALQSAFDRVFPPECYILLDTTLSLTSYVTEEADSVCLYFHDPSMYDPDKVKEGFEDLKKAYYIDKETGLKKYHTIRIRHIYCVINDGNGKGRKEVFDVE